MKELSKQDIESIRKEAVKLYPYWAGDNETDISFLYNSMQGGKRISYEAGATEQAIKAKELVEALETIRNWFPEKSDVAKVCKEALLNYKP